VLVPDHALAAQQPPALSTALAARLHASTTPCAGVGPGVVPKNTLNRREKSGADCSCKAAANHEATERAVANSEGAVPLGEANEMARATVATGEMNTKQQQQWWTSAPKKVQ
jgi:hypothetical protein